jgi:hypothetical protein
MPSVDWGESIFLMKAVVTYRVVVSGIDGLDRGSDIRRRVFITVDCPSSFQ